MSLQAFHTSARFGLGPSPAEMTAIGDDPGSWLTRQMTNPILPQNLLNTITQQETENLYQLYHQGRKDKKMGRVGPPGQSLQQAYKKQTVQRLLAQVKSEQPFVERLNMFWSNHFTVSKKKLIVTGLVNIFEVQAIRPHLMGYFSDMLLAVEQHPAMLIYLDNAQSTGPQSRFGINKGKNINENLGREILELHTLGVDSGYTQADVISLAKIITGWGLQHSDKAALPRFAFNDVMHEPGVKQLLGKAYAEDGMNEGIRALTDLAHHPATAKHLSYKLAQHFVADEPPPQLVANLAKVYTDTQGHLPSIYRALILSKEAWANPLGKFKNSYEYLVSSLRLNGTILQANGVMESLKAMNIEPFSAISPAGLPDTAIYWSDSDTIVKRVEWAHILSRRLNVKTNSLELAQTLFGPLLHAETSKVIAGAASPQDAYAFLLVSPEFQRR